MNAPGTAPVSDRRSPVTRLLVFGGIALILSGMLLGEVFAIFISHAASAQIRREWIGSMIPAIEQRDLAAASTDYGRIEELLERRGRIMDTHSHLIAYGFLAIVLALLQPLNKYSERVRLALALCIVAGGLIQSVSVFVSYWTTPPVRDAILIASAAGGTLVLVGVLGTIAGLRGISSRSNFNAQTSRLLSSASSQILLRIGALLILAGMVFGFYYAWVFVTQHEPQQISLLHSALQAAVSRNNTAATSSITAHRSLQSKIAIVTAAHSHVIEMGTMAVLLGFVQNFVLLSDRWKRRWAILFCIGGGVMPICTYSASIFGLVPAGFADTFGIMSIISLFAMLCGLVRQTGADELVYAP